MKRIKSNKFIYVIILNLLAISSFAALLDDNFDDFTTGAVNGQGTWTANSTSIAIVEDIFHGASGKSLSIPVGGETLVTFDQQTNTFEISWNLLLNKGTNGTLKADYYINDDSNRMAVAIHAYENTLKWGYYNGGWVQSTIPVITNTWLTLRVVLDVQKQKYSFWVDSGSGEQSIVQNAAFRDTAVTLVDRIRILSYTDSVAALGGPMWFDNVKTILPPETSEINIDNDFDDYLTGFINGQDGWTSSDSRSVISDSVYAGSSGKSFYTPVYSTITKNYPVQSTRFDAVMSLFVELGGATNNRFNIYLKEKDSTLHCVALAMDATTTNWQYNSANVWHTSNLAVETNKWLTLRMSVNVPDEKYSVWIDNGTSSDALIIDGSFRHAGTLPSQLFIQSYGNGPLWFDNVVIPIIPPKGTIIVIR